MPQTIALSQPGFLELLPSTPNSKHLLRAFVAHPRAPTPHVQVIKYFYYKLRYANEPMPPEFPIAPEMALELLWLPTTSMLRDYNSNEVQ